MQILLPPSEGKQAPARGKALDLERLSHGELTDQRTAVLDGLIAASARPDAAKILKVGPGLGEVVAANAALRTAPTAAAEKIYSGVLYDALGAAELQTAARRRMSRRVLIFSALFGVLRTSDRIPAYRLSGSVSLPQVGSLARYWRTQLEQHLRATGLVVDCRSASYAAMWTPPSERHLPVRVFREVDGERTVVSHMAKHSRGLVARALCEEASDPKQPSDVLDLLNGYFANHDVTTATGVPVELRVERGERTIDVITS